MTELPMDLKREINSELLPAAADLLFNFTAHYQYLPATPWRDHPEALYGLHQFPDAFQSAPGEMHDPGYPEGPSERIRSRDASILLKTFHITVLRF